MKVVFLDSDSLPVSIARPAWVTDWQDRPDTTSDQVVDAARDADAVITNKVRIGRAELEQLPNLRFI
jgi:glycerate dehydrogenase